MFMPTALFSRETYNITVVDDANISWPIRPIDFPTPDDEIVPYLNEAWQGEVYDQTLTEVTLPMQFSYSFVGTQRVALYGVALPRLDGKVATARYTLDDRPPVILQPTNVLDTVTNFVLFSADDLAAGSHTLTVEVVDAGPSYPYVVDYLQYESLDANPAAVSPIITPSLTKSSIIPSTSTLVTTATPSAASPSSMVTPHHEVGEIVGGAIGGLALLCIMVVALVWYLHSRHSQKSLRKASIFSADSMVQPRAPSAPLPAPNRTPIKLSPYKITKAPPPNRDSTVATAFDRDVKTASGASSRASTPVSERPPTVRLEPPRMPSISYSGSGYVPPFYDSHRLYGSPPAYSFR